MGTARCDVRGARCEVERRSEECVHLSFVTSPCLIETILSDSETEHFLIKHYLVTFVLFHILCRK